MDWRPECATFGQPRALGSLAEGLHGDGHGGSARHGPPWMDGPMLGGSARASVGLDGPVPDHGHAPPASLHARAEPRARVDSASLARLIPGTPGSMAASTFTRQACAADAAIVASLADAGFRFLGSDATRASLGGVPADWDAFARSWEDLAEDRYLAQVGLKRRRRHAVYACAADGPLERLPHQPHYQARSYNALQGGIERWFEPVQADGAALQALLAWSRGMFEAVEGRALPWRVEVHQFRIEAAAGESGQPTPEGVHRDGVDHVLVLMVARHNIARGTTTIHAPDGADLGSFTLASPLDAALLDDRRVHHGVTPVEAIDPGQPAWRDVLVVTFRPA